MQQQQARGREQGALITHTPQASFDAAHLIKRPQTPVHDEPALQARASENPLSSIVDLKSDCFYDYAGLNSLPLVKCESISIKQQRLADDGSQQTHKVGNKV